MNRNRDISDKVLLTQELILDWLNAHISTQIAYDAIANCNSPQVDEIRLLDENTILMKCSYPNGQTVQRTYTEGWHWAV